MQNEKSITDARLAMLDELIAHFKGFEDQRTLQYSASDIVGYLETFKKLEELEREG